MAAIDKIYGTEAQANEFYRWCEVYNPELLRYFYGPGCVAEIAADHNRAITNFPEWADRWLLENCTLDWVVEYINEQYGYEFE